jgi:mycofactocin system glycosyltransferase
MRLTEAGAAVVSRWLAGGPVATSAGSTALARRLVAAGLAHPDPPPDDRQAMTAVIPVKDDEAGLATTLAGLGPLPVIVVDDGSVRPVELPAAASGRVAGGEAPGAERMTLLRRDNSGGPSVARQQGLDAVRTPLVAFVDAGVEIDTGQLEALSRWFADPEVVAVAPRVAATAGSSALASYEQRHSPLDLGREPALVGQGRPVAYVPTACLVARLDAIAEVGGFDPQLRWGEDVDLVWRLTRLGQVRYDPTVVVHHPPRASLVAFASQRLAYGSAAGPLAARHGDELAPVRVSGWSLLCWGLALLGRPVLAAVVTGATVVGLARKIGPMLPDGRVEATQLAVRGHWMAGQAVARATVRDWWPLSVLALATRLRRPVGILAAIAWIGRLARCPGRPGARANDLMLGMLDDAAYGTGVWVGAWQQRSLRCLLPNLRPGQPLVTDRDATGGTRGATGR